MLWRIRKNHDNMTVQGLTRHKIRRVGTKRTIPNPALVPLQHLLEFEFIIGRDRPDLHRRVGRASGEISTLSQMGKAKNWRPFPLDIRAEKTAREILAVRLKFCDSLESG